VNRARLGGISDRRAAISHFELRPDSRGRQTFVVDAPEAQQIELIGDFTDWQVVRLSRTPKGTWLVTLPVGAGQHRMNLRVNGGSWNVPPGLPAIRDDFGGMVAILEVPVP
jgi:1,4-alpha-glucan branching enzyme